MSEYMERHAVSRLIGAPPGYVGFDQGGQLTEAVTKHPYSVVLMDEIEKAHPDIFNILLQVMDHGTLTDNNGRKADFRNVIIIMTTNAGADRARRRRRWASRRAKSAGDEMGEIKRMFTPEFRNRLDATISFGSLDHDIILRVVDKFLLELEAQLHEKKVDASFTPALKEYLAKKGFDPQMGARPMARLIQDTIRKALADELLFGHLVAGGKVTIDIGDDEKVQARASRKTPTEPKARKPSLSLKTQASETAPAGAVFVGAVPVVSSRPRDDTNPMDRRAFLTTIFGAAAIPALAQVAGVGRPARIGILSMRSPTVPARSMTL